MKRILIIALLFFSNELTAQNYKFGKVSVEELKEEYYPLDSFVNVAVM